MIKLFKTKSKASGANLLRRVKQIIRQEPLRLEMMTSGQEYETDSYTYAKEFPPCRTVACVAGWVVALKEGGIPETAKQREWDAVEEKAARYLGVSLKDTEKLFYDWHWDDDIYKEYRVTGNRAERVELTCRMIDRCIKEWYK